MCKVWILEFGDFGFWILDFGDFGFWILGILDFGFWDFGDFGFWILGILDFGFWGFWEFWILDFGILGILDFGFSGFWGFWILDFGFWILGILDFGFWGFWILDWGFWMGTLWQNFGCYIRKEDCARRTGSEDIYIYIHIYMCYESESKLQFLRQRMMKNSHLILLLIHVNTRLYDELVEFHCGQGWIWKIFQVPKAKGLETRKHQMALESLENFMKFFTPPKNKHFEILNLKLGGLGRYFSSFLGFFDFSFGKQKGPKERIDLIFFFRKKRWCLGWRSCACRIFSIFFLANAVGKHFLLLEHAVWFRDFSAQSSLSFPS